MKKTDGSGEALDLFSYSLNEQIRREAPLADRMRPRTLEEFVGQAHLLSPGRLLRRAIQADQLSSLILYGPPGTGKTTLARIIANTTRAHFLSLNAVLSGIKDIREAIAAAQQFRQEHQRRTILFIDEVHRFNKAQQDALLPHVENGTVILVGATTENPYFEVNKALVSRSRIFQLKSLTIEDLESIADQALKDETRGYGRLPIRLDPEARAHLVKVANGDARALLNALELAVVTSRPDEAGIVHLDLATAEESIQQKAVLYDKDGDAHFDIISAFIKSLRGSDPDAALYWMAKMVYGGEDPRFIFRRMIIFAGEDVGLADPHALPLVVSAAQAYDYVGLPEGRFHLAQACLYLATAPKSNSAFAFFDALDAVRKEKDGEVPSHLRDANRDGDGFGHGKGYLYPHAYREHWVAQQYLPAELQGRTFYTPNRLGYEETIRHPVARRREAQLAAMLEATEERSGGEELWQGRSLGNAGEILAEIRDHLFRLLKPKREALVLNLNAGNGLILGELMRQVPDGTVYALVKNASEQKILENQYQDRDPLQRPVILPTEEQNGLLSPAPLLERGIRFEAVIGKGALSAYADKAALLSRLLPLMLPGAKLALAESIPRLAQRLSALMVWNERIAHLQQRVLQAEETLYDPSSTPKLSWDDQSLLEALTGVGLRLLKHTRVPFTVNTLISQRLAASWFEPRPSGGPCYADYLAAHLSEEEIKLVRDQVIRSLAGRVVPWKSTWLLLLAER